MSDESASFIGRVWSVKPLLLVSLVRDTSLRGEAGKCGEVEVIGAITYGS